MKKKYNRSNPADGGTPTGHTKVAKVPRCKISLCHGKPNYIQLVHIVQRVYFQVDTSSALGYCSFGSTKKLLSHS